MKEKKNLAKAFEISGNTTRLEILKIIRTEEKCVDFISKKLKLSQPTISYHLKLLLNLGLVKQNKVAQWVRYKLNEKKLEEVFADFFKTYGNFELKKREKNLKIILQ